MLSAYQTSPHQIPMVNGHPGWDIHQDSPAELHQQPHCSAVLACGSGDQRSWECTWHPPGYLGLGSCSNSKHSSQTWPVICKSVEGNRAKSTAPAGVEAPSQSSLREGQLLLWTAPPVTVQGAALCKRLQAEKDIWKPDFSKSYHLKM